MNDDEDEEDNFNDNSAFHSDDDDFGPEATGTANNSDDLFNSLKSDNESPEKKPAATKRKLGAKSEVVKPPTKRTKKAILSDSDEDSSPKKVIWKIYLVGYNFRTYI